MNEKVQYYLEKTIPELEYYKENNIFSNSKLEKIIQNRRIYESKLNSSTKRLADFLFAIEYEIKLERQIKKKMEKNKRIEDNKIKENIEMNDYIKNNTPIFIRNRIIRLYWDTITNYPSDKRIYIQFLDYLISNKEIELLKELIIKKCIRNINDSFIWIYSAKSIRKIDINLSRILFQKGFRITNDQNILYNFFKSEIKNLEEEKMILEMDGLTLDLDYKLLEIIYKELEYKFRMRIKIKYPKYYKIMEESIK